MLQRIADRRWLLVLAFVLTPVCAAESKATPEFSTDEVVSVKLFSGLEYAGIVQKESTAETLTLLTSYGLLSFRRTDINRTHTNLSDSEKNIIRLAVRDADAQKRSVDTQRSLAGEINRAGETLPRLRIADEEPRAQTVRSRPFLSNSQTWAERMDRDLSKKLTLDIDNNSLKDVVALITSITNLNIIVDPKVIAANPPVTLKINDMDAGSVIRWVTKLTDTHAEVKDQAIFITDKPSKENDDDEKMELTMLALRVGAQIDLPADGSPLTDDDRVKIAQKIIEKESPKPPDFPGPDIGIGVRDNNSNPFGR